MQLFKILKNNRLSILFTAVILYLSFMNPVQLKEVPKFQYEDKLVHLVLYFVFTLILLRENVRFTKPSNVKLIFLTFVFPVVLGGLIEYLQVSFFPPRSAEWLDWIADTTGVILAWLLYGFKGKRILFLKE